MLLYPWKLLIQSMKCGLVTERVKGLSVYSSSGALRVQDVQMDESFCPCNCLLLAQLE